MAKYLDKWKTDFPASVGNVTRPTDGIDNTLDFNTDGFPQRISSDPVHYKLENDMASQLFSNDARLKEAIDANKEAGDNGLANHNKNAQAHANGIAGNAATASKLKTARNINVTGDCLTGTAASFDGSANANITVALCAVLKALGILSPVANKLPYFTGANAAALADLSAFMRGLLGKADAASVRSAIGIADATQAASGYMSAADKIKLDGIAAKANNYSLPTASASTLGGVKGGSGLNILNGILNADAQSLGVVAGDVSNADAWWVKLGGTIPLIIQGGKITENVDVATVQLPISFNTPISVFLTDILEQGHYGYAPSLFEITKTSMIVTRRYNTARTKATLWMAVGT